MKDTDYTKDKGKDEADKSGDKAKDISIRVQTKATSTNSTYAPKFCLTSKSYFRILTTTMFYC